MFFSVLSRKQIRLLEQLGFLKKYGFYLAGGTALAIQVGHCTSLNFDFYTKKSFDSKKLQHLLEKKFEKTILLQKDENTLIVKINDVAVSFFKYIYPLFSINKTREIFANSFRRRHHGDENYRHF